MKKCEHVGCDYTTINNYTLNRHAKFIHTKEKKCMCDQNGCKYRAVTRYMMLLHVKRVHIKLKPLNCSEPSCSYKCMTIWELRRHIHTTHNCSNRQHKCDVCNDMFKLPHHLKIHRKRHHSRCENGHCDSNGHWRFNYKYCFHCGSWINGITPENRRQDVVSNFIQEQFGTKYSIVRDKSENINCSKKRPDDRIITNYRRIINETDENQHRLRSCEISRMNEIAACGDILPTIFIRFNPDTRLDENGCRDRSSIFDRLSFLKDELIKWLNPETQQEAYIMAVYLFYDGPIRRVEHIPFESWDNK